MADVKSSKDGAISKVEKSRAKTGGRTAGTPNKRTKEFSEALETVGFDLPTAIKNLYESTQDEWVKLALIKLAAHHCVPVPKPKEVDSDDIPEVYEPVTVGNILKITNEKE